MNSVRASTPEAVSNARSAPSFRRSHLRDAPARETWRLRAVPLALLTACGDPFLPSDYAGPPVAAVSGTVIAGVPTDKVAQRPMLSLEWLAGLNPTLQNDELYGQTLSYARSNRLEIDWDIDLPLPGERAKLERKVPGGRIGLSVGKLVYYDDRIQDGRLDWSCAGGGCDLVKSISEEFVVFLEVIPSCRSKASRAPATRGFHYFRWDEGRPGEIAADEPLNFVITNQSPAISNPGMELRAFAESIFELWSISLLNGC